MTMLARINEEVDDEALKEEIMRCFLNAPTIFQAIQVMRECNRDKENKPGCTSHDMRLFSTELTN